MSIHPKKIWSKGSLFYALLVSGVVATTAFGLDSVFAGASGAAAGAARTATVQLGTVQTSVTASGNVGSAAITSLDFAVSGTLTAVDVSVGEHVSAGQVIAKLDPTAAEAALTTAEDQL